MQRGKNVGIIGKIKKNVTKHKNVTRIKKAFTRSYLLHRRTRSFACGARIHCIGIFKFLTFTKSPAGKFLIFTALHGMQSRYSDGNSVCLSVRLSVCLVCLSVRQTRALWQNGRQLCLDFYTIWKSIYPSFMRRRMVSGGRPLLPEILGQLARVGTKSPILNR